jgi:hypothetical protein
MLSSDNEGEVLGAVAGIKKLLRGAELDIHDLANGLINGNNSFNSEYEQGYAKGVADALRGRGFDTMVKVPGLREMVDVCLSRSDLMRDKREREFVVHMAELINKGRDLTPRQTKWLRAIYLRVRSV